MGDINIVIETSSNELNTEIVTAQNMDLTGNAEVLNVLSGKTFYKNNPNQKLIGTMTNRNSSGTTITPSTIEQAIPEGYYGGSTLSGKVIGDSDLVAENIKIGVSIFGVSGSLEPTGATLTGDAVVGNVLAGDTFYSNDPDTKLTGTMTNKVGSATVITPSTSDQTIAQGYYGGASGDGKVLGDADLIAGNIKTGVSIFGVTGNYDTEGSNPITAGTVLKDKVGFVNGSKVTGTLDLNVAWVRPNDWPDISSPANNTIKLLVADTTYATYAFKVIVASAGTYSVDWGDGTSDTGKASDSLAQHTYTVGTGTACNRGYTTFVITITATQNITRFYVQKHTLAKQLQTHGYLDCELGTSALTSCESMFSTSGVSCRLLEHFRANSALSSCTTAASMFSGCVSLKSVDVSKFTNVTIGSNMFTGCTTLSAVDITKMTALTTMYYMFLQCVNLISIDVTKQTEVTNTSFSFYECFNLRSIDISKITKADTVNGMFTTCYNLQTLTTVSDTSFASTPASVDMGSFISGAESLTTLDLSSAKLTRIVFIGSSGNLMKLTSLLFHPSSTFSSGTSPQIDIQYCSFDATQLNTLFTSLPVVTGKTIRVTGNSGAATCDTTIATGKGWTVTT